MNNVQLSKSPGIKGKSLVPLSSIESLKHKQSLPIYSAKKAIISEISNNSTLILVGETGSGKTTQLTQYLYEVKYESYIYIYACPSEFYTLYSKLFIFFFLIFVSIFINF